MNKMNSGGPLLAAGDMQLYDYSVPGLSAGDYVLSATQSLPNVVTDQFEDTISQAFVVNAPQFALNGEEIHAMFPGDQTNGDYSKNLPYAALNTAALPWERLIKADQPKTIPWMALLILTGEELGPGSPIINSTVRDFLAAVTGIIKPAINPDTVSATVLDGPMHSIKLPVELFTLITPRLAELSSLAHVRQVEASNQAGGSTTTAWYAELLANRFPVSVNGTDNSGMKNYAFIVSLEGLSDYLVDAPAWPVGATAVQLAVLGFWSFTSVLQPGQTFAELASGLSKQAAPPNEDNVLLRLSVTDKNSIAASRLNLGYTALTYHTQPGDKSFAWYRGPFAPFPAQELPATASPAVDPSQVLIYDQENALFDTSYAAAWTIGRLTALADPAFIDVVQSARQQIIRKNARLLERSKMPHLEGITDLKTLCSNRLTQKMFGQRMAAGMGEALTASYLLPQGSRPVTRKNSQANYLFPDRQMPASAAAQTQWCMQQEEVRRFLLEDSALALEPLSDWLAELVLLKNISFDHLVPDPRMLPQEAIRFFFCDPNWLKALFDGAISIGVHNSQQTMVNALIAPAVWTQTLIKTKLHRKPGTAHADSITPLIPTLPKAGVLIRSALISGWPGLQIIASVKGVEIDVLRMVHLSPTVLLALWPERPDTVVIRQPQQGLSFGVMDGWMLPLRSLNSANLGASTGTNFPDTGNLTKYFRLDKNGNASNVLRLFSAGESNPDCLMPALESILGVGKPLTPAQFAIEFIQTPEEISFNPPANQVQPK